MSSLARVTLNPDTVYKTEFAGSNATTDRDRFLQPSFHVTGGTVDFYWSNALVKPVDYTTMHLDDNGSGIDGAILIGAAEYVYFKTASGTPVIEAVGVASG